MAYTGLPRCAYPGCRKMPMVQVYGFRHNEYEDFCEEHHTYRVPPAVAEWTGLDQRLADQERGPVSIRPVAGRTERPGDSLLNRVEAYNSGGTPPVLRLQQGVRMGWVERIWRWVLGRLGWYGGQSI